MAGFLVPGPVDVWAKLTSGGPSFIGHSRQGLNVDIRPSYRPVQCDLYGEEPADDYYGGQSAMIAGDMIRVNFAFIAQMMTYTAPFLALSRSPGTDLPGDVGTLMVHEGAAYQLYLRFPYQPKPLFNVAGNVMVAGYHFAAVHLTGNPMNGLGPRPKTIATTWQARRKLNITDTGATNNYGVGSLRLFDNDLSEIAGSFLI